MNYDVSMEQKLNLIRTLRNEHEENQNKIKIREGILYPGKKSGRITYSEENPVINKEEEKRGFSSFPLRLIVCLLLFLAYFFMDIKKYQIGYFSVDSVLNELNKTDFSIDSNWANLIDFIK